MSFLVIVLISTVHRKLAQRYELRSNRSYSSIRSSVRFNAKILVRIDLTFMSVSMFTNVNQRVYAFELGVKRNH